MPAPRSGGARVFRLLLLFGLLAGACGIVWWQVDEERRSHAYDRIIRDAAKRHQLPPHLVKAVIRRESKFKCWVVGGAGEVGLMQVTPAVVRDWERATGRRCAATAQLFDPRLNIEIGSWCLARARNRWRGNPDREILALAQYNAGGKHATEWSQLPPPPSGDALDRVRFPETRAYIKTVLDYQKQYDELFPEP
jgi:soluble lytic murein transglycosylase